VNVLSLTGRLTADPVRRETSRGVVCEFRVAVDGRPRLWIGIEAWGQLAGRCAHHLRAGRRVAITGALVAEEYTSRAGDRLTRWYVRASTVTFLDRPGVAGQHGNGDAERVGTGR
jgi:single-strand DNA-binding protein